MSDVRVLRLLQIEEDCSCCYKSILQMIHTESLQILHLKMLFELLVCCVENKHPVVHFEGEVLTTKITFEHWFSATFEEYFLRGEIREKLIYIVGGSLRNEELTRGYVEERNAASRFAEMHCRQEVVFLMVQHRVTHCHTWCHQFGDATLHKFLRQLRVFQLVANRHTLSCTNQFGQIGVERMMWKTRHGNGCISTCAEGTAALGEGDAKNVGCNHCVVGVGFIKVATTKQKQSIWVLRLQVEKLFHHRRDFFFLWHILIYCLQIYFFTMDYF